MISRFAGPGRAGRLWAAAALLLTPVLLTAQTPPKYIITTFAGNGTAGFTGDAGAATAAELNYPMGIAFDSAGVLYIADQLNHRIRAVSKDGVISTVAGNGTADNTGDSGQATSATLNTPTAAVPDGSGNLYITDTVNHEIRKRVSAGTISRFAGVGASGHSGDTAAANLAALNTPMGVAVDSSGNVFIADTYNHVIRKVGTDGGITAFAGTAVAGYSGDGGSLLGAQLNYPTDLAFDSAGNLYVADTHNHRIRKITPAGVISTVAGMGSADFWGDEGPATSAALNYPTGITVDPSGNLIIADCVNNRIRMVTEDGKIHTIAGTSDFGFWGDGGPATIAGLGFPYSVARDSAGRIYFSDNQNSRIRMLTPQVDITPSIRGAAASAAFGGFKSVAPGSWIEIYGSNLASGTRQWAAADFENGQAPTSLSGTRVTIGGLPAYVAYVSPGQVNAQIPSGATLGSQRLRVIAGNTQSDPYMITVEQTQAGLLAPSSFTVGSKAYAVAILPDGKTNVLPENAITGVASRPAKAGETVTLYGTGFGSVTPRIEAGAVANQANALNSRLEVYFGDTPGDVVYAGLAPGTVGVYQFSVVVPQVAAGDAVPLTFTLGGVRGQQTLYTAVGN